MLVMFFSTAAQGRIFLQCIADAVRQEALRGGFLLRRPAGVRVALRRAGHSEPAPVNPRHLQASVVAVRRSLFKLAGTTVTSTAATEFDPFHVQPTITLLG